MARKLRPVKCMQNNGRWCATTKRVQTFTNELSDTSYVGTVCGSSVTLPAPSKRAVPGCDRCRDILLVAIEAINKSNPVRKGSE